MAVADTALYKALSRLAIPQDVLLWDPSLDVSNEFALLIHVCVITLVGDRSFDRRCTDDRILVASGFVLYYPLSSCC